MIMLTPETATGDMTRLVTTNARHLGADKVEFGDIPADKGGFGTVFAEALEEVNALEQDRSTLVTQALIDPDSVDVHDLTIAMAKANTAVSITKAVVDGALKAYNDILTMR